MQGLSYSRVCVSARCVTVYQLSTGTCPLRRQTAAVADQIVLGETGEAACVDCTGPRTFPPIPELFAALSPSERYIKWFLIAHDY